jgi:hypothetical protein
MYTSTNSNQLFFWDYTNNAMRYELNSAGDHDFKDGNIASGPIVVAQPAANQATMTFQRNQTSFGFIKFKHVSGNDGDLCIGSHDKGLRFLTMPLFLKT